MREFLRAKIHGATVTKADLEYEGSLGIDSELLRRAEIRPFESVEVYNISNGHRLRTYAIELKAGSGRIESNGAAAHWIKPGDKIIVATYAWLDEAQMPKWQPRILIVDSNNREKSFQTADLEYRGQALKDLH